MAARGGSSVPYLVHTVDRYGKEIEADLFETYGISILDFFSGRRPRSQLLRLIEQLRRRSRFKVARLYDKEYARQLAESGVDLDPQDGDNSPHLEDYGPTEARLDRLTEAVDVLRMTIRAVNGQKPGTLQRLERPFTAIDAHIEDLRRFRDSSIRNEAAAAQERRKARRSNKVD